MSTTLRELKYVLIGEDRLSNRLNGVSRAGYKATEALTEHSKKLSNLRTSFKDAADEIPGLNQGLSLLKNPIALGAASITLLGVGIGKATQEAQKFNSNFRELANLNLDKSFSQLKSLKSLVRDTAFSGGFDQNLTSKAFFDVQSIAGKYGGEVARIVEKQGEFANIFKADFNSWIAGTAKAMANYGFGAEKLDEFNKASYATYRTAYITFDELAKVQSVYAGAASSAKQSFSSANKMLSIFTLKTKSADEAATLTKSLFNDLTKKETISALNAIGISFFDSNNKIKQADKILIELNRKFKEFGNNDKRIVNLKNKFSGSDGLISFVQAATDQTGGLLKTLNDFDSSELGLNKALAIARRDTDYINQQLKNRTQIILSEMGDNWLPMKNDLLSMANGLLVADQIRRKGFKDTFEEKGASAATKNWGGLLNNSAKLSTEQWKQELTRLKSNMTEVKSLLNEYAPYENSTIHPVNKALANYYKSYAATLVDIYNVAKNNREKGISPNIPGLGEQTTQEDKKLQEGLNGIAGGGNAIRNITVNIQKLIETQQINTQNLTEGTSQIQQLVEAALIRAVAGTEQMIAQ